MRAGYRAHHADRDRRPSGRVSPREGAHGARSVSAHAEHARVSACNQSTSPRAGDASRRARGRCGAHVAEVTGHVAVRPSQSRSQRHALPPDRERGLGAGTRRGRGGRRVAVAWSADSCGVAPAHRAHARVRVVDEVEAVLRVLSEAGMVQLLERGHGQKEARAGSNCSPRRSRWLQLRPPSLPSR